MTKTSKTIHSQNGYTLFEMLVTIIIGTLIITMLMQMLVMTLDARRQFQTETTMVNESYYISEQIRQNIFLLQPHSITLIEDSVNQTVIHIVHEYDITTDAQNVLIRDTSSPITDVLTFDKNTNEIRYLRGSTGVEQTLHSSNISVLPSASLDSRFGGTSISVLPLSPIDGYDRGILELRLEIAIQFESGGLLPSQLFVSTIIV